VVSRLVGQLRIGMGKEEATIESLGNGEPGTGNGPIREVAWPGGELREIVRSDGHRRYRPLSGAKSLPGGWLVRCPVADVDEVVETIYPLSTVHSREWQSGELRVVSLEDVLERQTGRYAVAATLDEDGRQLAREVLCGDCVRSPVWAGAEPPVAEIPCPEPCSVLVSLCREASLWQQSRPAPSAIDDDVPYAAFDHEGSAIREAYIGRMA